MPVRAYYLGVDGKFSRDLTGSDIISAYRSRQGLLWVDVFETTIEDGKFLEEGLGFHHLAVEDCISPLIHTPKVDDFRDYLFIIVHGINHAIESEVVVTAELAVFLGSNFVVTNHNFPLYSVNEISRLVEDSGRPMRRGADFLAHAIIDALIDNIMPTIDRMSDVMEQVEEEAINGFHRSTLEAIMKLKRSTLQVHRVIMSQREVLNRMSRGEFPVIRNEALIFYRDIYDHMVRIEDLGQSIRDRTDNALSTYLSAVSNRQNETMRVLSIVATIFMPLTLLAGIYGMNFENMPELGWQWGYFVVIGFMAAVIVGTLGWFWARKWLVWGRRKRWVRLFMVEPEKLRGYVSRMVKHDHRG